MKNQTKASNQLEKEPLSIRQVIKEGCDFARKTFKAVFLFSFLMISITYALQFQTTPNMSDFSDIATLILVGFGIWLLSVMHAGLIIQMNNTLQGNSLKFKQAMQLGMRKSLAVFAIGIFYILLILLAYLMQIEIKQLGETTLYPDTFAYLGLLAFILPLILLTVSMYLALFIVVLATQKKETSLYRKVIDYIHESFYLLKGSWWKMLGLMLLNLIAMLAIWGIYQILLKGLVVLAVMFYISATAVVLTFWYGCILALLLELKARKKEKYESIETAAVLKKSSI